LRSTIWKSIEEVLRRSAWQVVPVYLGASWAILEATSLFSERFGLPVLVFDLTLGLLAVGLATLVALILLAKRRAGARWDEGAPAAGLGTEGAPDATGPGPASAARSAWRMAGTIFVSVMALWGLLLTVWLLALAGPSEDEIWAETEALPRLSVLIADTRWEEAYQLAGEIEVRVETVALDTLWGFFTDTVMIRTDLAGATVHRRPYGSDPADAQLLGSTPLQVDRFPRSPSVLRFEAPGHRPIEIAGLPMEFGDSIRIAPTGIPDERFDPVPGPLPDWAGGPEFAFRYVSPNLSHAPTVLLGDYALGRREVTNVEFRRFVDAGGYERPELWTEPIRDGGRVLSFDEAMSRFVDRTGRPGPSTWEISDFPEGADSLPVGGVSWYEAMAFARFSDAALPTIYHWFRGSTAWRSAWILPLSNMDGDGPRPVASAGAMSQYGHQDMAGNVREWVYNASGSERFILGGGWEDPSYMFTVANSAPALDRSPSNGIRLAEFWGDTTHLAQARMPISPPSRDFFAETPVSDEVFEAFRRMYAYDPRPLAPEAEAADTTDLWIRERVVIDAGYGGERLPVYLFRPREAEGPLQTVVYFPGSGATWLASIDDHTMAHVEFLLKGGRAVAFPVLQSTFEREDGFVYRRQDPSTTYREHVVQWVKEVRRTIDYLETRDDVDADRLAYFGYSWGGMLAPITLAVEPRFRAAVVLVGGLSALPTQPEVDPFNFVTRVALPVLMLNGEYDMIHPVEEAARPMFELLATPPDDKRLFVSPVGHIVMYPDMIGETLGWLDRYLGRPIP
jgi:dienelactone hydrolase